MGVTWVQKGCGLLSAHSGLVCFNCTIFCLFATRVRLYSSKFEVDEKSQARLTNLTVSGDGLATMSEYSRGVGHFYPIMFLFPVEGFTIQSSAQEISEAKLRDMSIMEDLWASVR